MVFASDRKLATTRSETGFPFGKSVGSQEHSEKTSNSEELLFR